MLGKFYYLSSLFLSTKSKKKVVVIESDDWGSERIPSVKVRNKLASRGIDVNSNPHSRFDTLERLEDLELFYNELDIIERQFGKKVKITTNFIVGNPDFEKIREQNYQHYFFEDFTKTYEKRDGNVNVWLMVKKLIHKGYFVPQFHGREHINVMYWLNELKDRNKAFLNAFDFNCYGIDAPSAGLKKNNLMAAFEYGSSSHKMFIQESICEGLEIFESKFLNKSSTLVVPRHIWDSDLEETMITNGVSAIQTSMFQLTPEVGKYKKHFRYTGMQNHKTSIKYLVRNAFFEPSYNEKKDWVNQTFQKVKLAFLMHVPVIIGTHRLNFVGGIDPYIRDKNLIKFSELLKLIINAYPEVEFLSSNELNNIIDKTNVRN
jgi:hypothetical protein